MTDLSSFRAGLQNLADKGRILMRESAPLRDLCSFKIGGPADLLIEPTDPDALATVIALFADSGERFMILGNGSNVLFADGGYRGAVIRTLRLDRFGIEGDVVHAECGVSLTALSVEAAKAGLSGLEFAYGIPGSVGGAVFMNAGAYGGQIADVLISSRYADRSGKIGVLPAKAHAFGYRTSAYQAGDKTVLSADFRLTPDDPQAIRARMQDYMTRRKEKQPLEYPSAGSTFKRAPGHYTGQLIEEAGLKGLSVGGAEVSQKHAGFVINRSGATAADVTRLIERIRTVIYEKDGIELECEVRMIPENGENLAGEGR